MPGNGFSGLNGTIGDKRNGLMRPWNLACARTSAAAMSIEMFEPARECERVTGGVWRGDVRA